MRDFAFLFVIDNSLFSQSILFIMRQVDFPANSVRQISTSNKQLTRSLILASCQPLWRLVGRRRMCPHRKNTAYIAPFQFDVVLQFQHLMTRQMSHDHLD